MKWCFLVNNIDLMMEFLGKLAAGAIQEGDSGVLVFNSKMAEYSKAGLFPKDMKKISKVDWLMEHYDENRENYEGLSWKEFFSTFERKKGNVDFHFKNASAYISQMYQFLDFVFATEKPDVVVNEAPANLFTLLAYYFCQKYGVQYLGFIGSKFTGKIDVYDLPHTFSKYQEDFEAMDIHALTASEEDFAKKFVEGFTSHKTLPPYMDFQLEFSSLRGPSRYMQRQMALFPYFLKYLKKRGIYSKFDYESEHVLKYNLSWPWQAFLRNLRKPYFKAQYLRVSGQEKYFLYPLHFEPEASTLVLATYVSDQLNTIKNIAFSLPFPHKLYVKEHPVALGTRSSYFYKKVKELPNVVLVSSQENNESLIKKSSGVITLTSTVGMEAALLGKPVYILGDVFYEHHPLCRKIRNFDDLRERLQKDAMHPLATENADEANLRFVLSYFKNTVPGDVAQALKEDDTNDYREIHRQITSLYGNRKSV